ncbi:hypothetical protein LINGRAHAP2_LOCUS1749 [Linum grandiflorum]
MLLRDLSPESPPDILHLRLLHAWKLSNPSKPDQFFAFGTLWTDAEDPRYRCEATVIGLDQHQHWCYRACTRCSSAVVVQGFDYWCAKHEAVPTYETTSAELAAAYPHAYGELPPPIQILVGQRLTFEVHLPPRGFANAYSDFRISRIWGLHAPRAPLLALLPAPPPPDRSPRYYSTFICTPP